MAIVRRYFSTAGSGAADGTSWADRAAFLSAGVISTIIRGFDYTSDSLEVFLGPGTYTITTSISAFTGAGVPTALNPCMFIACDSSGNRWVPPDPDWCSAQPMWSDTDMPIWNNGSNQLVSQAGVLLYGIKAVGSHNGVLISTHLSMNWCYVENTNGGTSTGASTGSGAIDENCVLVCSGTGYAQISNVASVTMSNVRMVGNLSATSGARNGWITGSNGVWDLRRCTIINNVGIDLHWSGTGTGVAAYLTNCLIWNATATGGACVSCAGTRTSPGLLRNNIIVRAGTFGFDQTGSARHVFFNNAFRDCSSGNVSNVANLPTNDITITETDSQLFVDSASLDLRIKSTSAHWGKNLGAGDEPAAGGVSGFSVSRLVT